MEEEKETKSKEKETSDKEIKKGNKRNSDLKEKIENKKEEKETPKAKEKVKKAIENCVNSIWFPIIMGIILLLKTILFYKCTLYNGIELNEYNMIYITIVFIGIIICILESLPNRLRVIMTIIVDTFLSVLLLIDNLYYAYSGNFTSIAQISNLQYGEQIMGAMPSLVQFTQLLYFADIIFIVLILIIMRIKLETKTKMKIQRNIARVLLIIIAVSLYFVIANKKVLQASEYQFDKNIQVQKAGIYGYHISDIYNVVNTKKKSKYKDRQIMEEDYNKLKNQYSQKYKDSLYAIKDVAKNKNIIIVQLESVQEFVINKTINGKEITPNFNKFVNENIEISNMFMQSYTTTADSEFSTLTSLYPVENGMAFSKYYANTYDDLIKKCKQNNYTTSYMHGNHGFFWNRFNVYTSMGVDNLELKDKFADVSEDIMGFLSDELLYKQAVPKMQSYKQPFMSYVVSASSHTGFTLDGLQDRSKVNIDVGKYKDTFFGNYLESVNYADYAFGIFIQELKNAGLYDDSVILIYGDHNGLTMYDQDMIDFLKQTDPDVTDIDIKLNYIRVASAIKIPGVKNIKIDKPTNKLDIKPTIDYICGFDNDNQDIGFGTNMFGDKDFVCLNNEIIVTSDYYYDDKWYYIVNGEEVNLDNIIPEEKAKLDNYYNDMKTELELSNSIIVNNLLETENK